MFKDNQAWSEYKQSLTFRVRRYVVTAENPPNTAQLGVTPTIPPSYIRVRVVVWACGEGQTDTDTRTDGRDHYTFRVTCDSLEINKKQALKTVEHHDNAILVTCLVLTTIHNELITVKYIKQISEIQSNLYANTT